MRKAYTQMHVAILLWGFTAILGKLIHLDAGMLVWYRMLISSIATLIYLKVTRKFSLPPLRDMLLIAGTGSVIAIHWITFYGAIKASNVSVAISCFSSVALFTSLLDALVHKRRPRLSELLLALAVISGIFIIFYEQQLYLQGILLSLVSAALAASFTILNKHIGDKYEPGMLTFLELGCGFIFLTLFLPLWFYINQSQFAIPSITDWLWLLLLGIFCTTLAFTLSLHALKKLDAFTLNMSVNLEPVYSILFAILIFHEDKMLNNGFYAGALIIFSSVILHGLLRLKSHREQSKKPAE